MSRLHGAPQGPSQEVQEDLLHMDKIRCLSPLLGTVGVDTTVRSKAEKKVIELIEKL